MYLLHICEDIYSQSSYFVLSCIFTSVGQEDLKSLQDQLHCISHKWYFLGIQLQIPTDTLKCIRSDNRTVAECLVEMLAVWLKHANPPPTWNILTEALDSSPVGEGLLAKQLRDKYCTSAEGGVTHRHPIQETRLHGALLTPQGSFCH